MHIAPVGRCLAQPKKSKSSISTIPHRSAGRSLRAGPTPSAAAACAYTPSSVTDPSQIKQGTPLHAADLQSHYDAVVVGSGMGGLTAAVGLAKFGGKRVLVLEQHYTAGGFTHAFKRGK